MKKTRNRCGYRVFDGAGYGNRTRLLGLGSRCTTDVLTLRSEAIIAENFVHCNRKMPFGMIFLFYA